MQLVGLQIYNLDIARIKKQYKEMKVVFKLGKNKYNEICNNKSTTLCTDR